MNKFVENGKVAVLYSPGFGAGWSTWASDEYKEFLCMDYGIVKAFLDGGSEAVVSLIEELYPDVYVGGADQLTIKWVDEGCQFEIEEYDGSESIHIIGNRKYLTA